MINRLLCAAIVLAAMSCSADRATSTVIEPESFDVYTPGLIFSPTTLNVPVGAVVNFHISGDPHNAIFDKSVPGVPADINIVTNVVMSRTFTRVGTFPYDCTVHPGMSGQIVVH
jgi:plastocyanin